MTVKNNIKLFFYIIVLLLLLFITALVALRIGSADISIFEILGMFKGKFYGVDSTILLKVRLPRILLAISVGGALSLAGVLLQGLFRNPLVEPYTLGISGGAALGVSLNIVLGISGYLGALSLSVFGLIGALIVVFIVYWISMRKGLLDIQSVLLTGVMVSFMSSSLVMLLMSVTNAENMHGIVFWIMGSLEEPDMFLVKTALFISLGGLLVSYMYAVQLNALSLGEEEAQHLGIDVEKTKKALFIIASLLTGASVSVAGIIGFIGLVVPHFVRITISRDNRFLILCSYILGAVFLIICDTMARTIILPMELPVGVITGVIGGGLFIYALSKKGYSLLR